jgi:hypothetical protein
MRLNALIPLSVFCLVPIACGGSSTDAETPDPNNPCPAGQYCPPPAPLVTPTPTTTAAPAPTTPGQATAIPAAAATPILTSIGADEVKGMKPEGSAFAANFTEGQTFEQPLNLNPGKCYAVVGASLPGIQELDIKIVTQPLPPLAPLVLAQDQSTGPTAIVGGKGACFKNALPMAVTGKVILTATRGQGIAGAQIYVK